MKSSSHIGQCIENPFRYNDTKAKPRPLRKRCSACKKTRVATKFNKDSWASDGYRSACKECTKARQQNKTKQKYRKKELIMGFSECEFDILEQIQWLKKMFNKYSSEYEDITIVNDEGSVELWGYKIYYRRKAK